MVRAPCCEKMGLKKGPWTPEEDQILISYIQQYGHGNWRALPKQAGLLRCGKSCRLRWTNYLRPDIKRGNFTREEEETIIELHQMLGNRWSTIAARLPGRTDNEIKNVWHTHLKKRLKQNRHPTTTAAAAAAAAEIKQKFVDAPESNQESETDHGQEPANLSLPAIAGSPQQCASDDISSVTTTCETSNNITNNNTTTKVESESEFAELMDENFWSEVLSADNSSHGTDFPAFRSDQEVQLPHYPLVNPSMEPVRAWNPSTMYDHGMGFWFDLFTTTGELPELSEF